MPIWNLTDSADNFPAGGAGAPTFWTNVGDDIVNAFDGDDIIDGGAGVDILRGGAGADTYVIDNTGDVVDETGGAANELDLIFSSVSVDLSNTSRVTGLVEAVQLLGTSNLNVTGNAVRNYLIGNQGNNIIDGSAGADSMWGRGGNDTYIVDNVGDLVDESIYGGSGIDTVRSSVSFNLGNVSQGRGALENLSLTGLGNINAYGNSLNNVLNGNSGNNILSGGNGNDTLTGAGGIDLLHGGSGDDNIHGGVGTDRMYGNDGNDTLFIDTFLDSQPRETFDGGVGTDTIVVGYEGQGYQYDLRDAHVVSIEAVTLVGAGDDISGAGFTASQFGAGISWTATITGSAAANSLDLVHVFNVAGEFDLSGLTMVNFTAPRDYVFLEAENSNDTIIGTVAADLIDGRGGNDVLNGGPGNDTLIGTGFDANDIFLFDSALNAATNVDTIRDMNQDGDDTIHLENAIFTTLAAGALAATAFHIGAAAADESDRIVYNSANGQLSYDSNGDAAGGSTLFAILDVGLALAAADFFVV